MTDSNRLTDTEHRVLNAIRASVTELGHAPTVRELGAAAGLSSTSTVIHVLNRLALKGAIRRDPNRSRAISVLDPEADDDGPDAMRWTPPESEAQR